ncbi:hypothetical protein EIP86_010601 [Pleurotus ostreatoroseus]|nr:hypothetical protein EIP86_010601 [Pleurotus ostreatoroseus]
MPKLEQPDFEQVMRLDDKNEAARQELKKIEKILKSSPAHAKKIPSSSLPPKRRRVPITIIDPSSPETARVSDANRSEVSITSVPEANNGVSKLNTVSKPRSFQEAKQTRTADSRVAGGGIFRPNGQHTVFKLDSTQSPSQDGFTVPKLDAVASSEHSAHPPTLPIPHKVSTTVSITLFDLKRRWECAKSHRDRWTLLAVLH